jgi:hypothetical protein
MARVTPGRTLFIKLCEGCLKQADATYAPAFLLCDVENLTVQVSQGRIAERLLDKSACRGRAWT